MEELVKRIHRCAVYLPEKFNKNAELLDVLMKAADAIENTSKAYNMMAEVYEAEVTRQWWIPVEERLPETRKVVLITDGIDVGTGWMNQGWWNTSFADIQQDAVTHWMPLPKPPEEE